MALKLDTRSNFRVLLSIVCLFAGIASRDQNLKCLFKKCRDMKQENIF